LNKNSSVDTYFDKKIVLHVGLPKAASAFMRRAVFPRLDSSEVFHSQTHFKSEVGVFSAGGFRNTDVKTFRENFKRKLENIDKKTILLSEFSFSGNPANPGEDYESFHERTNFLKEVFPNAQIIFILRNQIDWLVSIYRNIVEVGERLSMDEFLGFEDGEFRRRECREDHHIDGLGFDFSSMCDHYVELFGREKVHIFFQEDLKNDPDNFIEELRKVIGCDFSDKIRTRQVNRGSSAFVLALTRFKNRLFKSREGRKSAFREFFLVAPIRKLKKYDIHNRPFLSVVENIETKHIPAVFLRRVLIKLSVLFYWILFTQHILDRIIYIDWDILGEEKRKKLKEHYAKVNKGLLPYFSNDNIKKYYLYKSE